MHYFLFRFFPKSGLSRLLGWLASRRLPGWLLRPGISLYVTAFRIDMAAFETPPGGFQRFNEFFSRPLRPGARPIDPSPARLVSPVDGAVSQAGPISGGRLFQAKGRDYSLESLLGGDPAWAAYQGGSFATLYLSPRDYHRIHAPLAGSVTRFRYEPGELWSVSPAGVRGVPELFTRNERVITFLDTAVGEMALVAVGATVVGKIRVVYHPVVSNLRRARPLAQTLPEPFPLQKGQELGRFEIGSTVILVFRPGQVVLDALQSGQQVLLGQGIGTVATAKGTAEKRR